MCDADGGAREVRAHVPAPASLEALRSVVDARVDERLHEVATRWGGVDDVLAEPVERLRRFVLDGGKRLRPGFCRLGHLAAGGDGEDPTVLDAGAALELLHAFALVHDDVMDGSALRRGAPTVHVLFDDRHRAEAWAGESRRFGEGMAVLIGDLAVVLADTLLDDVGPEARAVYDELRVELVMGQLLDVAVAAERRSDPETSRRISLLKSAKYTVERPLHLGAAIGGRLDELAPALSAYGLPVGEAFQLRDDLLGAFGDVDVLGKPVGDDFREAKPTLLVALATGWVHASGGPADAHALAQLGRPDLGAGEVDAIRSVLEASGARAAVEDRIDVLLEEALLALEDDRFDDRVRAEMAALARYCCHRDR